MKMVDAYQTIDRILFAIELGSNSRKELSKATGLNLKYLHDIVLDLEDNGLISINRDVRPNILRLV